MGIQHGNEKQRYWSEVIDERTGTRRVTVAAEITFTLDEESGALLDPGRLLVAGGNVATAGLITIDEAVAIVVEAHDIILDGDDIDVTVLPATADAPSQLETVPEAVSVIQSVPEDVSPQRTRPEEQAAHMPTRFV
jgi:hypothetical protein